MLILDDGFQHRRLGRDLDLVLIDATCPWGYDAVLPRGLLREPKTSLRRADLVILTRADQVSENRRAEILNEIHRIQPQLPCVEAAFVPKRLINANGETCDFASLKGRPVGGVLRHRQPGRLSEDARDLWIRNFRIPTANVPGSPPLLGRGFSVTRTMGGRTARGGGSHHAKRSRQDSAFAFRRRAGVGGGDRGGTWSAGPIC